MIDYIEYFDNIWLSLCDYLRRIIWFYKKCKFNSGVLIYVNVVFKISIRDFLREINMCTFF